MSKVVRSENKASAVLETFDDGSGRVTFFREDNHWGGEIMLTKKQIDYYYSE